MYVGYDIHWDTGFTLTPGVTYDGSHSRLWHRLYARKLSPGRPPSVLSAALQTASACLYCANFWKYASPLQIQIKPMPNFIWCTPILDSLYFYIGENLQSTLQKKSSCFNHWVVTLVAGDNGYKKFILVLEVNCISNLSSNHTLQLTIFRTTVSESLQKKKDFVVILSQRLLYLQQFYCMLFDVHAGVTSFKDA